MKTDIKISADNVRVYLLGDIDHHSAQKIREEIDEAILRSKPKTVVLDFSDVGFMDSSGIGLVMGRYRLLKEFSGNLEIENASKTITRLLALGGIERIITLKQK